MPFRNNLSYVFTYLQLNGSIADPVLKSEDVNNMFNIMYLKLFAYQFTNIRNCYSLISFESETKNRNFILF